MRFRYSGRPLAAAVAVSTMVLSSLALPALAADDRPSIPTALTLPAGSVGKAADSGYLPGDLNISPSGEATYDIPLDVPAGPAGTQPSLGLAYSSRAGNSST